MDLGKIRVLTKASLRVVVCGCSDACLIRTVPVLFATQGFGSDPFIPTTLNGSKRKLAALSSTCPLLVLSRGGKKPTSGLPPFGHFHTQPQRVLLHVVVITRR